MLEMTLLQSNGAIAVNLAAKRKEAPSDVDFGAIIAEIPPVGSTPPGNSETGFAETAAKDAADEIVEAGKSSGVDTADAEVVASEIASPASEAVATKIAKHSPGSANAAPTGKADPHGNERTNHLSKPLSADHRAVPTRFSETVTVGLPAGPTEEGSVEAQTPLTHASNRPNRSQGGRPDVWTAPGEMAPTPSVVPRNGPASSSAPSAENAMHATAQMQSSQMQSNSAETAKQGGFGALRNQAQPGIAAASGKVGGPASPSAHPRFETQAATGRPEQARSDPAKPTTGKSDRGGLSATTERAAASGASAIGPGSRAGAASPAPTPRSGHFRSDGSRMDGHAAPLSESTAPGKPADISLQPVTRSAVDRSAESTARTEAVAKPSPETARSRRAVAPEVGLWQAAGQMGAPRQATIAVVTAAEPSPAAQPALLQQTPEADLERGAEMPPQVGDHGQPSATQGFEARAQATSPHRPEHIARQIAEMLQRTGERQAEIRLNPDELGRVKIHMTTSESGILMSVNAERPETLDLMRRHIDILTREFEGMGYTDIQFSFGGDGAKGGHQPAPVSGHATDSEDAPVQAPPPRNMPRVAAAWLDMRM